MVEDEVDERGLVVVALLRLFAKDASIVALRCVCAQGGKEVDGKTMKESLMYSAKVFLHSKSDVELNEEVREEIELMKSEEGEGEGGEEGNYKFDRGKDACLLRKVGNVCKT